jgi:predicted nucleic acid-binding protein
MRISLAAYADNLACKRGVLVVQTRNRIAELGIDHAVIDGAKALMPEPCLPPRDALHAAHAIEAGCELIVSSDPGFDEVSALRRLGPG